MLTRLPFVLFLFALTQAAAQAPPPIPAIPATIVSASTAAISGRLVTSTGPVVGGSVRLDESGQISITNSEGEFYFRLLYNARTQPAVISYAGGADIAVTLVAGEQPTPIEVPAPLMSKKAARAQKKAIKYGRKQGAKLARKAR